MSISLLRSRATQRISIKTYNNLINSRLCSTNPSKVAPLSSTTSSNFDDPYYSSSVPPPSPPPPTFNPPKKSFLGTVLKVGLATAVTGVFGAAGYATYAYTVEEVDKKTKAFRTSSYSTDDDASTIDKLRTSVVSVPAKAIDFYLDMRRKIEEQVKEFSEPLSDKLLPDLPPNLQIYTLVVDLNETLVYSDWKRERGWRTFKRPGVDAFLEHLAQYYEIVVYSDSLQMYVDPILERLDEKHYVAHRLSRAATLYKDGKHYRDLSKLNRDPRRVLYISGHALEQCLQPENCIEIKPWASTDDVNDTTLLDLIPFLEFLAKSGTPDIRKVLESYQGRDIAKEFIERSKEYQRRMEQKQKSSWRR